jgi:DNA primase
MPLSQFLISEVTSNQDLHTAEGRARAQFDAKPLLTAMPPSALRLQLIRQLAEATQSSVSEIEGLFEIARPAKRGRPAPPVAKRRPPVEMERQVLRILLAHPALAKEIEDSDLSMISASAPDGGETLSIVVQAARGTQGEASFASLAEALRGQGEELDRLLGEVATETPSELKLAHGELLGAVRQTRIKTLKAELDQLASKGLPDDASKIRYREIVAELDRLRAVVENEPDL